MNKYILLICVILISSFGIAQNPTIGLLYHDNAASEGYTLFTPQRNNEVFLINNCGEKIRQWTFTEVPGATCYLLPNGNLLRAGKDHIEIRDWNNIVVWSYATTANGIMQHHDIQPLPNGNVLCIAADTYSLAAITAQGRNPAISGTNLKLERIIELQPVGTNNANIVWEWKFKEHLVQDFDATKLNYGIVQDHPELLDLNYANDSGNDYIHFNGIDYNADLDQILVSARHLNEIYIIDHSTTTAQASGHSGGNSNKGGDILWRWGNPEVYRQGTIADKKLFLQHDAKWVENGYLDGGKITVFNNGDDTLQPFSSIVMLVPEIVNGVYTKTNNVFNPSGYDWSWSGSILGTVLYESRQSGTHSLPNGNLMICETSRGRVSEITKSGTLVWSYKNPTGPIVNLSPTYYNQTDIIPTDENGMFRAEKYPPNFSGFTGRDLTPVGILENNNTLSVDCSALVNPEFNTQDLSIKNPVKNKIIEFNKSIDADAITVFDVNGRIVFSRDLYSGNQLEIDLSPSIYFMVIQSGNTLKKYKLIISQ